MNKDYKAFFGLSGPAFGRQIAVEHLLSHSQIQQLHNLLAATLDHGSIAVLTGPVGAGKSTALRAFLASLHPERFSVIGVGFTTVDRAVFREMAQQLGLVPAFPKGDLVVQVHTAIEQLWMSKRRQTILIVDDAHLIPDPLLVELRQLLNYQMDSATPLALFLSGKPALRARLADPRHEELYQRAPLRYSLAGLSRPETTAYVAAHMTAVGGDPGVFTEEAVDLVYQQSKGIPREINNICVYALVRAGWEDARVVDRKIVDDAIRAQGAA